MDWISSEFFSRLICVACMLPMRGGLAVKGLRSSFVSENFLDALAFNGVLVGTRTVAGDGLGPQSRSQTLYILVGCGGMKARKA